MPTPLEVFPHAPLVERCIEVSLSVTVDEFHEKAAGWMAEIGETLGLTEHKSVEHWVLRIDMPRKGPPKPRALLFSVPQVHSKENSIRQNVSVHSLQFVPPSEQGPSYLKYSQCKPANRPIQPFAEIQSHFVPILDSWSRNFGDNRFGQLKMSYWNDLKLLTDAYFAGTGVFLIGNALNFFRVGVGFGTLIPPWSTVLNWEVPDHIGSSSHLEIRTDGSGPIWTIFSYNGRRDSTTVDTSLTAASLDIAHGVVYEMFKSHFTREALQFCELGKVIPAKSSRSTA